MKKILILHRYPLRQVAGTNASFEKVLEQLSERGYEVYYLSYKDKEGFKKRIDGVKYVSLPLSFDRANRFSKTVKTVLWIFIAPLYVRYLQNMHKLDIVYCDDSVPYYGFLTKLISPSSKVIIRLGGLQSAYRWAEEKPTWFERSLSLEAYMWKKMDGIIAISESYKKFILKKGVAKEKVSVVRESIDLGNADFSDVVVPSSGKLMFHGSIIGSKGLETLIDGFKIFNRKYPKTQLVIAGGGEYEERIKKYAREKKVKNVVFTGWFDHERLAQLMREVQIGVISRGANLANNFVVSACMLEYWSYKKPVIVPDLAAFKEVVKDKENGLFYKVGDAADLADKMEYLYSHPELNNKLAMRGLNSANRYFNNKKIAIDLVNILETY